MKSDLIDKTEKTITEAAVEGSATNYVPEQSVLMVMRSGILRHSFPVAVSKRIVTLNQDMRALTPHLGIQPRYLARYLKLAAHRLLDECSKDGTTVNSVETTALARFPVPIAPVSEQRRIVARIDALFAEIAEGEAALYEARRGLELFRRAFLKSAVTGELTRDWRVANPTTEISVELLQRIVGHHMPDELGKYGFARAAGETQIEFRVLATLPPEWSWAHIGTLGEIVGGVTVNQKRKPAVPVTVPYLRVANVQRGHIDLGEVKMIIVEHVTAERLRLAVGDLLLNEGGDRDKIGRGWVWDGCVKDMIHQNHVFRIRLYNSSLEPHLLSHYCNEVGRRYFIEQGKQTTNLASISSSKLCRLPVPIIPSEEQKEISRRIDDALTAASDTSSLINAASADAARLKQSILKAAFEGRLVPQDPNDEPASILLDRLRAEPKPARIKPRRAKR